ncbi:MAG: hypothetical protein AABZ24_05905 [Nitrospirota bacterium]
MPKPLVGIATQDIMKNTQQTYVLTLDSSSKNGLRLWQGQSIHALRHCSVKQIGQALREMQQNVDSLQAPAPSSGGSYSLNRGR